MSDELHDEPRRDLRSIILNTLAGTPMLTVTAYDTSPADTSLTIDDIRYDICFLKEDGSEVCIDADAGAARDIRDALTFLLRLDGLITVED